MPQKDSRLSIRFNYLINFNFRKRNGLKLFIHSIFIREKRQLTSLQYVFCSDKYLLKINQDYLNRDDYTDIISFDLSSGKSIEGEIYISIDRVKENARFLDRTFKEELHRVIFHGALHLCGFNDKTGAEKRYMTKKEDEYLQKYFNNVPRNTVSR